MTRVVIIGGHGDGAVVAETIKAIAASGRDIRLHGFLNDALPVGTDIAGSPVLGRLDDWAVLPEDIQLIPVIHKVGQMPQRLGRLRGLGLPRHRLVSVIHPTAAIASDATIGAGCFIASHVTVQPGAIIGDCATIRGGANVGHDARLGEFTYMGPNSTLCGRAELREGACLGPNAAVLGDRIVGRFAVVGLCSAVLKDVPEREVVLGNPARTLSALASLRG